MAGYLQSETCSPLKIETKTQTGQFSSDVSFLMREKRFLRHRLHCVPGLFLVKLMRKK